MMLRLTVQPLPQLWPRDDDFRVFSSSHCPPISFQVTQRALFQLLKDVLSVFIANTHIFHMPEER
ncbi:hypothetical protein EJ04DRAFT_58049 [Polyplosphaeria fusca]|uniref:Uncharacterized protein n=1 Tax=Polyplosphaeria fusca TaxID=682080 RepID=A0A9P4QM49_9PLEO|nr:hypothetical protein EJ04DRAFT_58049 [Polyplosphaeria fusca]